MIPKIKKILYTTDLSKNARYAFGYAASLSGQYNAGITILHVLEEFSHSSTIRMTSVLGDERWREIQKQNEQEVIDTIQGRLEKFCEDMSADLSEHPFSVDKILVKSGQPVEVILKEADRRSCDIVVMGTHGQGGLADAMLGSTARRVVRRSPIPVLTIRLSE